MVDALVRSQDAQEDHHLPPIRDPEPAAERLAAEPRPEALGVDRVGQERDSTARPMIGQGLGKAARARHDPVRHLGQPVLDRGEDVPCDPLEEAAAGVIGDLAGEAALEVGDQRRPGRAPDELSDAARVDGARPMQFFWLILLPLSRSNIVAMAIILFLWSWNQYLWPLLVTTEKSMSTAVIGLRHLMPSADAAPSWHVLMSATLLTLAPPVAVVLLAQLWFIKGLIDSGK